MPHYLPAIIVFLLFACSSAGTNTKPATPAIQPVITTTDSLVSFSKYNISITPTGTYTTNCAAIKRNRTTLAGLYAQQKVSFDSVQHYFTESLLNGILPHWYGTVWSFDGHTSTPGTGEIACGYLVSTTLAIPV